MSGMFVVKDGKIDQLPSKQFAKEVDFQKLLADYPALLSGSEINPSAPRRWLLISREKSIPANGGGEAWWSLDHLFLDQDAIPTFVEVKRSSNKELRRLVVAQMLDYAANAVKYWRPDELLDIFMQKHPDDADSELRKCIGEGADPEAFWKSVKSNLQEGRVRLLFVADIIPPELRRIVEFLNEQMEPAEVLALELRKYEGNGLTTIVPVLFGQTSRAVERKNSGAAARTWTEEDIYDELEALFEPSVAEAARKIVACLKNVKAEIVVGRGNSAVSIRGRFEHAGKRFSPFAVWTSGLLEIGFKPIQDAFSPQANVAEHLREMLKRIDGVHLPRTGFPTFKLKLVVQEKELNTLLEAIQWVAQEAKGERLNPST